MSQRLASPYGLQGAQVGQGRVSDCGRAPRYPLESSCVHFSRDRRANRSPKRRQRISLRAWLKHDCPCRIRIRFMTVPVRTLTYLHPCLHCTSVDSFLRFHSYPTRDSSRHQTHFSHPVATEHAPRSVTCHYDFICSAGRGGVLRFYDNGSDSTIMAVISTIMAVPATTTRYSSQCIVVTDS